MPALMIGMPLFNNAQTLDRALSSLRAQSFRDFTLLMSDDCSTDATAAIAEHYARLDDRFRLVKQSRNLNYGNFRYVLSQAKTEFFMFAAGDDWWDPRYVEACIDSLLLDDRRVCAVSRVRFFDGDKPCGDSLATSGIVGSVESRVLSFLRAPNDNSRMYGVFRTAAAQAAFPNTDHHAYDWTFSARSLLYGSHYEVPQTLMFREWTPWQRYSSHYVRRDARSFINRALPLLAMTICLMREKRVRSIPGVKRRLLALNIDSHLNYVKHFHPIYCKIAMPVLWRVFVRL
jgi:glycosyltransferase involved in cell wall biosynthesis